MTAKKRFLVLGILYAVVAVVSIGAMIFFGGVIASNSEGLLPEDFLFSFIVLAPVIFIAILSIASAIAAFAAFRGSRTGVIVLTVCSIIAFFVAFNIPRIRAGEPLLYADIVAMARLMTVPLHLTAAVISVIFLVHTKPGKVPQQMQFRQSPVPPGLQNQQYPYSPVVTYQPQYPPSVPNVRPEDNTRRF